MSSGQYGENGGVTGLIDATGGTFNATIKRWTSTSGADYFFYTSLSDDYEKAHVQSFSGAGFAVGEMVAGSDVGLGDLGSGRGTITLNKGDSNEIQFNAVLTSIRVDRGNGKNPTITFRFRRTGNATEQIVA